MTDKDNENKEVDKKKKFLWILLLLIIFLGILGGGYFYLHQDTSAPKNQQLIVGEFLPKSKDATDMTYEELKEYAQKEVNASQFRIMINPKVKINYNTQSGYIGIKNPKINVYPINVTFYTDDGKEIYTSGAIQPGQEVTYGTLSSKLQRGKYQIKAKFDIYDYKTHIKRGQQFVIIKIFIQ